MEFANDPIARRIREAAGRGTLSHALLFSGSGDRIAAAQYAAAAMECQGGGQKPCGTCPACRKVFSGIHPDVITVRDEAHKNLSVDTVRQIRSDAYIRPNEGSRKVYTSATRTYSSRSWRRGRPTRRSSSARRMPPWFCRPCGPGAWS